MRRLIVGYFAERSSDSELVEDEEGRPHQAARRRRGGPVQMLAKVEGGKDAEDGQGDDLLDHFELVGREAARAPAVGRNLQALLEEGDAPTDENHHPQRYLPVLQVAIPGEGHKNIRKEHQYYGSPRCP